MDLVLYIHGRGGSAGEAAHYAPLFPGRRVLGLKGLAKGRRYLVQLVLHGRSDGASATAPNGARAQCGGEGWPRGGSLVGVFTADAETMAFALTTTQWTTLNAIQVRELPAE